MVQKEVIVSESDYIVNAFIFGDTNYNYNGFITIRNISERTIEDWSLAFTSDIDVINFHTAELIERQGNHFLIKNQ